MRLRLDLGILAVVLSLVCCGVVCRKVLLRALDLFWAGDKFRESGPVSVPALRFLGSFGCRSQFWGLHLNITVVFLSVARAMYISMLDWNEML